MEFKDFMAITISPSMVSFGIRVEDGTAGKVIFSEIHEAAYSIHPDSVNNNVPLGDITQRVLENEGKSNRKEFTLVLESCALTEEEIRAVAQRWNRINSPA